MVCDGKFESIEQLPYLQSKFPAGKPQVLGSGCPEVMSAGIDDRGNMYILMNPLVHHIAYMPPPLSLKGFHMRMRDLGRCSRRDC